MLGLVVADLDRDEAVLRAQALDPLQALLVEARLQQLEGQREVQDVGVAAARLCERDADARTRRRARGERGRQQEGLAGHAAGRDGRAVAHSR